MSEKAIVLASVSTPQQAKKISLDDQERDGLAYCRDHDLDVVDIIRIPGYSRRFITLRELVEAASAKGHAGPAKLEQHLNARDFNTLVVRTTSRFGREQAINAEIITKVVKWCRGRIIAYWEGSPIDKRNFRTMIMVTGYRDSMEVDELVEKRRGGIRGLVGKGLPPTGRIGMSHTVVRDAGGKLARVELNRDLLPMWEDLAALLFENVPYDLLEEELFRRWGYGENGKPYHTNKLHRMLKSAPFWGNQSLRILEDVSRTYKHGLWVFDPSIAPPAGTDMYWNTHEAVYKGELAERVKAELRRRTEVENGVARKSGVHLFTGLVVCDACRWRYAYTSTRTHRKKPYKVYKIMRCRNAYLRATDHRLPCPNTKAIAEWKVREWLEPHLARWVAIGAVDFNAADAPQDTNHLPQLRASIATLERRVNAAAGELLDVDDDLKPYVREQLRTTKDELDRARHKLSESEQELHRRAQTTNAQTVILDEIRTIGLPDFWQRDALFVNQRLHALMGSVKLVGRQGEIVGFVDSASL